MLTGKVLIIFFTGTGNSLWAAEAVASGLKENKIVTDIKAVKEEIPTGLDQYSLIGFFYPVYSLDAPRVVSRFLKRMPGTAAGQKVFLIATMGGKDDDGWSTIHPAKILSQKGYNIILTDAIQMPNNWTTFTDPYDEKTTSAILQQAGTQCLEISSGLLNQQNSIRSFHTPVFGKLFSVILYAGFKYFGINLLWRHYKAGIKCNSCKICVEICPVNAIKMKKDKPRWSSLCEQCMRCYNMCPSKAIMQFDAFLKGSQRERYTAPGFDIKKIKSCEKV